MYNYVKNKTDCLNLLFDLQLHVEILRLNHFLVLTWFFLHPSSVMLRKNSKNYSI